MYRLANNSISSSISYRRNIKTILGRSRISLEHVGHRFQYSSIKHDPNKILIIETSENNIKSYYIKDDKGAKHISEEKGRFASSKALLTRSSRWTSIKDSVYGIIEILLPSRWISKDCFE